jgi:hypothetical protein
VLCTWCSEAPTAPNGSRRILLAHQKRLSIVTKSTLASSTVGMSFAMMYLLAAGMHTAVTRHSCTSRATILQVFTKPWYSIFAQVQDSPCAFGPSTTIQTCARQQSQRAHANSTDNTAAQDLLQRRFLFTPTFHARLRLRASLCCKIFMPVALPVDTFLNDLSVRRADN